MCDCQESLSHVCVFLSQVHFPDTERAEWLNKVRLAYSKYSLGIRGLETIFPCLEISVLVVLKFRLVCRLLLPRGLLQVVCDFPLGRTRAVSLS